MDDILEGISLLSLRAAAVRVADRITGHRDTEEAVKQLVELARAIEAGASSALEAGGPLAEVTVQVELLRQLRGELLHEWASLPTQPPAAEMLRILQEFERVHATLGGSSDPDLARFIAAASGPELLTELAHDLRSPLTSILFLSETLLSGQSGSLSPHQHRQLGIIYSAALSLVTMASDVIELARGGDGLFDLRPSEFSVTEMFDSICSMVRPMAEGKDLELRVLAPGTDRRVGYPVALSRVLLNLITNAIKFTENGFVEIAARSGAGDGVEFSVRDTGRGLDEETVKHLYRPFRRSASSGRFALAGSGLGLAICRKLVRSMSSDLHHETAPNWGTRFYFALDLPPADPRARERGS